MGGSHFLKVIHSRKAGRPPRLDFARERAVHGALRELIRAGHIRSAHDCSEGGLAVALAECCFNPEGSLGAEIDLSAAGGIRLDCLLFNESQSRIVISVGSEAINNVLHLLEEREVLAQCLGIVGGDALKISAAGQTLSWPIDEIFADWWNAIANHLGEEPLR
jgi:phosphoribosylformylglycinamidine synthase